jgi:hypothetical protein
MMQLLVASGFLFMGATEEQMQLLDAQGVDHVSYILILYSVSFLMFLCMCSLLSFQLTSTNITQSPTCLSTFTPSAHSPHPSNWTRKVDDKMDTFVCRMVMQTVTLLEMPKSLNLKVSRLTMKMLLEIPILLLQRKEDGQTEPQSISFTIINPVSCECDSSYGFGAFLVLAWSVQR